MKREERLEAVFDALADATRRRVIRALAESGEATATSIASGLPVTRQAVSKHLAALSEAGLVRAERSGRETFYRLTPRPLTEAVGWMAEVGAEWDERLNALQRHLRKA
jgi:DNA-binding transcriptional ArsR family regulator